MTAVTVGRIVLYRLSDRDAQRINSRRQDGLISNLARERTGAVIHFGNDVREDEEYPLIVTRVWTLPDHGQQLPPYGVEVNGQVLLDGSDSLWVTSVREGNEQGQWHWPERV